MELRRDLINVLIWMIVLIICGMIIIENKKVAIHPNICAISICLARVKLLINLLFKFCPVVIEFKTSGDDIIQKY